MTKKYIFAVFLATISFSIPAIEITDQMVEMRDEIYRIANLDKEKFRIPVNSLGDFFVYGENRGELVKIKCTEQKHFYIAEIGRPPPAANIGVGECTNNRELILRSINKAEEAVNLFFGMLPSQSTEEQNSKLTELKRKLVYQTFSINNEHTVHEFPIIGIGHGVFFSHTIVVTSKKTDKLYIIQGDVNNLCNSGMRDALQICSDTSKVIRALVNYLFI